jgi:hypothetical protein
VKDILEILCQLEKILKVKVREGVGHKERVKEDQ